MPQAAWRATVGYFENQVHRMDYPSYLAKGWQIGSGPVEAACKTVIGLRLKGIGMRWRTAGSAGISPLLKSLTAPPLPTRPFSRTRACSSRLRRRKE